MFLEKNLESFFFDFFGVTILKPSSSVFFGELDMGEAARDGDSSLLVACAVSASAARAPPLVEVPPRGGAEGFEPPVGVGMGVELVLEEGGAFIEDAFAACPTLEGSLGVFEEASAPRFLTAPVSAPSRGSGRPWCDVSASSARPPPLVGVPPPGGAEGFEPSAGVFVGVEPVLAEGGGFIEDAFAASPTS